MGLFWPFWSRFMSLRLYSSFFIPSFHNWTLDFNSDLKMMQYLNFHRNWKVLIFHWFFDYLWLCLVFSFHCFLGYLLLKIFTNINLRLKFSNRVIFGNLWLSVIFIEIGETRIILLTTTYLAFCPLINAKIFNQTYQNIWWVWWQRWKFNGFKYPTFEILTNELA